MLRGDALSVKCGQKAKATAGKCICNQAEPQVPTAAKGWIFYWTTLYLPTDAVWKQFFINSKEDLPDRWGTPQPLWCTKRWISILG